MKARQKLIVTLGLWFVLSASGMAGSGNVAYENNYQRGLEAVQRGDLKRARVSFSTALFYKPGDADAQRGLELTEERLGIQRTEGNENRQKTKEWFLRLSAGSAPGIDESFPDDTGAYEKDDGTLDLQFEAMVVKRFGVADGTRHGGLFGAGLFLAHHTYEDEMGAGYSNTGYGFLIQAGFVTRIGDHLYLELIPYIGLGGAAYGLDGYGQVGIKMGAYLPVGKHELGLEVGYADFGTTTESGRGLRAAVVLSL
jgi:hypothetical protein